MEYSIKYYTGVDDIVVNDSLDNVMKIADENSAYTQTNIEIVNNETGCIAAERRWCGIAFNPDIYEDDEISEDDILSFGSFGYYEPWMILE